MSSQYVKVVYLESRPRVISNRVGGAQGPQGTPGLDGATGAQGPQGDTGPAGPAPDVVAGTAIAVDSTDPAAPIVSAVIGTTADTLAAGDAPAAAQAAAIAAIPPAASDAEAIAATEAVKPMTPATAAVRDEKYDVQRSGVVLDDATDNAAALSDAVNVVHAAGGGVALVRGIARTSAALDLVGKTGVKLAGTDLLKSAIKSSNLAAPIVRVGGSYLGISDLQLRYTAPTSTAGATAFQMEGLLSYSEFKNLYLWNCHTGLAYGGVASPTGEFSNTWDNIRIGPFSAQGIRMVPTATGGTGSNWGNVYVSNWNGSAAGACTDYPVQITNHGGVFNQLNVEWCSTVASARDLILFQQCHGIKVNRLHLEGNILPASRGFITTFTSGECTVAVEAVYLYDNEAASGSIGIVRPGAGTHIGLRSVALKNNTGIAASLYAIFDTSIATGAVVMIDGLLDPDGTIDGFSLNYAGSAHVTAYKGADIGFFGVTPVGRRTLGAAAIDAATTQTLANALRQALIDLGLGQT